MLHCDVIDKITEVLNPNNQRQFVSSVHVVMTVLIMGLLLR